MEIFKNHKMMNPMYPSPNLNNYPHFADLIFSRLQRFFFFLECLKVIPDIVVIHP